MRTLTGLSVPDYQAPEGRPLRILLIGAHPDDAEIKAAGTACLWTQAGHEVKMVSMTNGAWGHQTMKGTELTARRKAEAAASAAILGVAEEVLDNPDGEITSAIELRRQTIQLIREWRADIVITHRPNDYHPDHRYTSVLVQDASFLVTVPNYLPEIPRLERLPVCLFFSDHFQEPAPFRPDIAVDTTAAAERKRDCFAAMPSQFFEWLPWNAGFIDEVPREEAERLRFLEERFLVRDAATADRYRSRLGEIYGEERAGDIRYAEAFQLSEFGSRPSDGELTKLFPIQ